MTCICRRCSKKVSEYGFPCKSLLKFVCQTFSKGHVAIIDNHEFDDIQCFDGDYVDIDPDLEILLSALKYLENKGYVISQELPDGTLGIVPNIDNSEILFCWCKTKISVR